MDEQIRSVLGVSDSPKRKRATDSDQTTPFTCCNCYGIWSSRRGAQSLDRRLNAHENG